MKASTATYIGLFLQMIVVGFLGFIVYRSMRDDEDEGTELNGLRTREVNGKEVYDGPYEKLQCKRGEYVGVFRDHYIDKRSQEIEDPSPFESAENAALYELKAGTAPVKAYIDDEFVALWQQVATQKDLPASGDHPGCGCEDC